MHLPHFVQLVCVTAWYLNELRGSYIQVTSLTVHCAVNSMYISKIYENTYVAQDAIL